MLDLGLVLLQSFLFLDLFFALLGVDLLLLIRRRAYRRFLSRHWHDWNSTHIINQLYGGVIPDGACLGVLSSVLRTLNLFEFNATRSFLLEKSDTLNISKVLLEVLRDAGKV